MQQVFTVPSLSAEQCDRLCEYTRERVSGKLIDTVDNCPEWQARRLAYFHADTVSVPQRQRCSRLCSPYRRGR